MQETKENNNVLKKVLIHVIGWPLFVVVTYIFFVEGGTIAWRGVYTVKYLMGIDQYSLTYKNIAVAFHAITQFIFGFFISYFFGLLLFREKRHRLIFSSVVSIFCAAFIILLIVSRD